MQRVTNIHANGLARPQQYIKSKWAPGFTTIYRMFEVIMIRVVIVTLYLVVNSWATANEGAIVALMAGEVADDLSVAESLKERKWSDANYNPGSDVTKLFNITLYKDRSINSGFRFLSATDANGNPSHELFKYIGRICAEPAPGEDTRSGSIPVNADARRVTTQKGVFCSTFTMINACEFVTAQHALFPDQILVENRSPIQRQNISIGWGYPLRDSADRTRLEAFPHRARISDIAPNLKYFPDKNGKRDANGAYYVNSDYDCVTARIENCEPGNPKKSFSNWLAMFSLNRYKSKMIRNCAVAGFELNAWMKNGEIMLHENCKSVGEAFADFYEESGWRSRCSSAPGVSGGPLVCNIDGKSGVVGLSSGGSDSQIVESGRGEYVGGTQYTVIDLDQFKDEPILMDATMNIFTPAGNCSSSVGHIRIEF